MEKKLQCFAFGRDNAFEAYCIDLDIAVTGSSFSEVYELLNRAVATYVEDALNEEPAVTRQLLNRRAPWHVRVGMRLRFIAYMMLGRWNHGREEASFDVPCPA